MRNDLGVYIATSVRDAALSATLLSRKALFYSAGTDVALDRPAHVRAGSSLAWFGNRIAVIQDDANFVALIDPKTGQVDSLPLPAGKGGLRQFDDLRGNKPFKLDLEACFSVPLADGEILVALGSGSSELRETVAVIDSAGVAQLYQASGLYDRLRSEKAFSGGELNVEGAVCVDGKVLLFNRGNGAWRHGEPPRNASCEILWPEFDAYLRGATAQQPPAIRHIVQYDLGELRGSPLTFTDVAATASGLLYTAAAEDSPDAMTDGVVTGSVIGVFDDSKGCHWIELRNTDGSLIAEKIEGLCSARDREGLIYVVVDADDPNRPSTLCEVALEGPWFCLPPRALMKKL